MRVLYAIQTTGNGHLSRAQKLVSEFSKRVQVDVYTSGPVNSFPLNHPIQKHYTGLTLFYKKDGRVDWLKTLKNNHFWRFIRDVFQCPVHEYDLILNDFEPVTAWACFLKNKKCFALSNQFGLTTKKVPKPKGFFGSSTRSLSLFAPAVRGYGFHYKKYNNDLFYPIIRDEIRKLETRPGKDILVYLPAYALKKVVNVAQEIPERTWHIFSLEVQKTKQKKNVWVHPVDPNHFLDRLANCGGVMTAAGFTTTAEALYLGKPLLVIPTKAQIEQQYNAVALKKLGVTVLKKLNKSQVFKIQNWAAEQKPIRLEFKEESALIVDRILLDYIKSNFIVEQSISKAD